MPRRGSMASVELAPMMCFFRAGGRTTVGGISTLVKVGSLCLRPTLQVHNRRPLSRSLQTTRTRCIYYHWPWRADQHRQPCQRRHLSQIRINLHYNPSHGRLSMEYDALLNDSDRTGQANPIILHCRLAFPAGPLSPGDGAAVFCSLCPQLQHHRNTLNSLPHAVSRVHDHKVEQLRVQNQNTRQTNQLIPMMTIMTTPTCSLARRLTFLIVEGR